MSSQLEEKIAHLEKVVSELSDVMARQDQEISRLTSRLEMIMKREAERAAGEGGGVIIGDERPPHW